MIRKSLIRIKIALSCLAVMLLTGSLIVIFHIAAFLRKLILGNFIPDARKDAIDQKEELIGSANAQMNAIQATLEKRSISSQSQRTPPVQS